MHFLYLKNSEKITVLSAKMCPTYPSLNTFAELSQLLSRDFFGAGPEQSPFSLLDIFNFFNFGATGGEDETGRILARFSRSCIIILVHYQDQTLTKV